MTISYKDFDSRHLNYQIKIAETPCNYGNYRYWFICPLIRNGIPCNKRIGVLYKPRKGGCHFGCRHCYNLTYASSNVSGKLKSFGIPLSIPEIDELKSSITKWMHKGNFTKRCKKYLKEMQRFRNYHVAFRMNIMEKIKGV